MIYVVLTPGRTGSHLICDILSKTNYTIPKGIANAIFVPGGNYIDPNGNPNIELVSAKIDESRYLNCNLVIHTHNREFINEFGLNPKDVTLVLSKRRDIFSSMMSSYVCEVTDEYVRYTNKHINPILVDKDVFLSRVLLRLTWYDEINLSVFHKCTEIYYEDLLIYGDKLVASKLNLLCNNNHLPDLSNKSPYHYKNIILNWPELFYLFKGAVEWKQHGFSSLISYIDAVKKSNFN